MADISKCKEEDCPLKNQCYRYVSVASEIQSYFSPPKKGDDCEYFIKAEETE